MMKEEEPFVSSSKFSITKLVLIETTKHLTNRIDLREATAKLTTLLQHDYISMGKNLTKKNFYNKIR